MKKIFLLTLSALCINILQAQVAVQSSAGLTPQALVNSVLVGNGVTVTNVTFNGSSAVLHATTGAQIGTFTNNIYGYPSLGFSSGLIIGTGDISIAPGPNSSSSSSSSVSSGYYCSELENLISGWGSCNNPAVLEFDFATLGNAVAFNYVFASEEYPEFAGSSYNDVFGFFVTDMVTYTTQNIALIPGTNLPVTINNVNASSYSQYYIPVPDYSSAMQYDAHTTPFSAKMNVVPCRTYHMKIAIANVSDYAYDSAVFLEAQSFNATAISTDVTYDNVNLPLVVYGCNNALLTFSIPQALPKDTTLQLTYSGTAINGVDFQQLPQSVTIYAGQTTATIPIIALPNYNNNDTVTLTISYSSTVCTATQSVDINVQILNDNRIDITSQNVNSCVPVDSVSVTLVDGEYSSLQWTPSNNLTNPHDLVTGFITPFEGTEHYTIVAIDKYGCLSDTTKLTFTQGTGSIDTITASICEGKAYTQNGFYATTTGFHTQTIPTAMGCDSIVVLDLTVMPISVSIDKLTDDFCENFSMTLEATGDNIDHYLWSTGDTASQITVTTPGLVSVTASNANCTISDQIQIIGCSYDIFVPNTFTPNDDGINDIFYLPLTDGMPFETFAIYIYDRWGRLIYTSDDPYFKWDGTYKGKKLQMCTLSYRIDYKMQFETAQQLKGHINIIR
ncbi:MAG: choice-of-anchor L domain-containing protein [Bacteroidales bacterium]|nr:choice-of-anchor L domain-containing protein [Bacteroidales bacterium]